MSQRNPNTFLQVEDYLAGERESAVRHEYVDGQIYALGGASDRHNRIAGNIYSRLVLKLGEGECEPFISDMKLMVDPVTYYYPDVLVARDPPGGDPYVRTQARLVVEVMSPSTERFDRNEKLFAYKRIPSLLEYVLVAQDVMYVEIHRRGTSNKWPTEVFTLPEDQLSFTFVDLHIPLADVYRNARLP